MAGGFFGWSLWLYIRAYGITLIDPIAELTIEVVATLRRRSANGIEELAISLSRSAATTEEVGRVPVVLSVGTPRDTVEGFGTASVPVSAPFA